MYEVASIHTADFHIGWGDNKHPRYQEINEFIDYIEEVDPVFLGLIGDIADLKARDWPDILVHPTWIKLQKMVEKRSARGRRTAWIRGNRDYDAKSQYLPGAELVYGKITLQARTAGNPGPLPVILIHGWQWDVFGGGVSSWVQSLATLLFPMSIYLPSVMIRLNKLYSTLTPFEEKQRTESQPNEKEKWNLNMIFLHSQARHWATRQKAVVILGHTHFADTQIGESNNSGILNAGDWTDSFSYVVHEASEPLPELRYWKSQD